MTWENRFTFEVEAPAVFDAFSRTASSSWGTADSGQAWGQVGTAADFSVSAGLGRHALPTAATMRESFLDVGSPDFDMQVDVAWPVNFATSATLSRWICGRYTDANNYYVARLDLTTSGTVVLGLSRRLTGVLTTLVADVTVSTATYVFDTLWRVRFVGTGTSLMARAWLPTSFEPDVWTVQTTDTGLTSGTGVALLSRAEVGNINVPLTVTWDNFVVASPTAWVDLTLRIRDEVQPIDWASGRQNNLDQAESGQLTVLLDNSDGIVTFGNIASPYAAWWGPGRRCRLRERIGQFTFDQFTGYLQMPEENSVTEGIEQRVAITATDRLARLNADRAFISTLAEHIIYSGGTTLKAYWPLNDRAPFMSVTGTAAYQTVGETYALNFGTATASSGAPAMVPSSTEGPPGEDVSFPSYTMRIDTVGGFLRPALSSMTRAVIPSGSITLPAGTMLTVVAWINSPWSAIDSESTPLLIRFTDPAVGVIALVKQDGVGATWLLEVSGATTLAASMAGTIAPTSRWTQVAIRFCFNPNVIELWVDGALSATGTLTGVAPTSAQITDVYMPEQSFDGSVAHVQLYMGAAQDFSLTTFAAQRAMALTGLERQTTGDRISTIARYAGIPTSQLAYVDAGVAVMQVAQLSGKDPLTAMREAETTERGLLYVDGGGNLVFADRRRLYNI